MVLENYHLGQIKNPSSKWNFATILTTKTGLSFINSPEYRFYSEEELKKVYDEIILELNMSVKPGNNTTVVKMTESRKKVELANVFSFYLQCNILTANCFLETDPAKEFIKKRNYLYPIEKVVLNSLMEIEKKPQNQPEVIHLIQQIVNSNSKGITVKNSKLFLKNYRGIFQKKKYSQKVLLVSPPKIDFFSVFDTQYFRKIFPNIFTDLNEEKEESVIFPVPVFRIYYK
ncbi:hypothetical protein M0811_08495 [Anaeramoeba ignava]|uniref:Uncharacterized protein n=1 Tax=Anaeramoeba ignava TaxID=1746090 RepID=A0A9Q0LLM2_ANAIG|nr:hypothetical protein M0811_08495 [Anaeramoeba ignava]